MIILVVGSIYYLENQKVDGESFDENALDKAKDTDVNQEPKEDSAKVPVKTNKRTGPDLVGITGYINAKEGITLDYFKGKVVLVDFWTYSCINCIRTLPYLTSWDEKYKDKGLVILGVHTPEFEFEKDKENVMEAMERHGIKYRVLQDNNYATWKSFKNRFWPRKYLLDATGEIRYDHIGEGAYVKTEMKIQELLKELGEEVNLEATKEEKKEHRALTPELYAGYKFALPRSQKINEGLQLGVGQYSIPSKINDDKIYIEGKWESSEDSLILKSEEGKVVLSFLAGEVNIVADGNFKAEVLIDGKEHSTGSDVISGIMEVDTPRLYNVYNSDYGRHTLEIKVKKDFSFNAFTFG